MGALIRLSAAGGEAMLVSLGSGTDGTNPDGALLEASDGNLYALTGGGATRGAGAMLQISLSGTEQVLYSFGGGSDGTAPAAGMIASADGTYGLTAGAGSSSGGTVFAIN
jgi:hypothetical protein